MKRFSACLLALALAAAATAQAQPGPTFDGGADPGAADAFAGRTRAEFYAIETRLQAIEDRAGRLGRRGAAVRAEVRRIRAFEAQQRARHGGELRDWDREAVSVRLDRLETRLPPP